MEGTWFWNGAISEAVFDTVDIAQAVQAIRVPCFVIFDSRTNRIGVGIQGALTATPSPGAFPVLGILPPIFPEWLGSRTFTMAHGLRFAYLGGGMAHGISSSGMVASLAENGMLGFFGTGGMRLDSIERELLKIQSRMKPTGKPWGMNFIQNPEPDRELQAIELFLRHDVRRIEAAAFMSMNESLVLYLCKSLRTDSEGRTFRRRYIFAKISRPEVAKQFMSPPPEPVLASLRAKHLVTDDEIHMARKVPVAEDIIVEADSGGHTDGRPLNALFPRILTLAREQERLHGLTTPFRVGAAGGIGTPSAAAAAFAMGADFILVGSVHQSCLEAGNSTRVKKMLEEADITDMQMTLSPGLFEQGGQVQVLKKGTHMGLRARQLYRLYQAYESIEQIPPAARAEIEQTIFRMPLEKVWKLTADYFERQNPLDIDRANANPRVKMALIFKWYLGQSSQWAIQGDPDRVADYQIWCSPAMGAFNSWTAGSFLAQNTQRSVAQVALNLLEGAARLTRVQQARVCGVPIDSAAFHYQPTRLELGAEDAHNHNPSGERI